MRSFKKSGKQSIGKSRGGWSTKIHMISIDSCRAYAFSLSPGNSHDAPEGRLLLEIAGKHREHPFLLMDRAYQDDKTRFTAWSLGFNPVVPPKSNRLFSWDYDTELYKKRNEVERLFRRLKGFRRISSRFDKLDSSFMAFIYLALIFIAIN